jgi:hypothetical protein
MQYRLVDQIYMTVNLEFFKKNIDLIIKSISSTFFFNGKYILLINKSPHKTDRDRKKEATNKGAVYKRNTNEITKTDTT